MGAVGVLGVALAASFLEGMWAWLLASSIAEVVGQAHPSSAFMVLLLFVAWLCARVTGLASMTEGRRRGILAVGGLAAALAAGTIQAGLILPVQLVFGDHTPDFRAAGIMLFTLVAYLWARGLWLAIRVTRRRLINHIVASASGLIGVLVLLPLTDVVQQGGLGAVVASFLVATAGLLMIQLTEAESHRLTTTQWAGVAAGMAALLVVGAAAVSGAFSSGALRLLADGARAAGRAASPLTDAVLLGLGYLAHVLAMVLRWLAEISGIDAEAVRRAMRAAQEARPRFEDAAPEAPPEVLAIPVALFLTTLTLAVIVALLLRLVRPTSGRGEGPALRRQRIGGDGSGLGAALRSALDRIWWLGPGDADASADPRRLIRRHYRAFQMLMAQAEMPRHEAQTPVEFERTLREDLPSAGPEIAEITQAYVVARYADDRVSLADPRAVEQALGGVRDALRGRGGRARGE